MIERMHDLLVSDLTDPYHRKRKQNTQIHGKRLNIYLKSLNAVEKPWRKILI